MEDEQQSGTQPAAPKSTTPVIPSGSLGKNYGSFIGASGVMLALITLFNKDPHSSIALFAEFGPKYVLWGFIAYIVWDLLKKGLRVANKGADNMGVLAQNTGVMATAVTGLLSRNDRQMEEMQRVSTFSAQQSERAVELVRESNDLVRAGREDTRRNTELLLQLHGKLEGLQVRKGGDA